MQYRRNENISIQEIDGELFLADDTNGRIYHPNAIAASFWRALQQFKTPGHRRAFLYRLSR